LRASVIWGGLIASIWYNRLMRQDPLIINHVLAAAPGLLKYAMHSDFVPLHVHSQYSLLDGAIRIDDLVEAASRFKLSAVALTDHGNLFGAVEFFRKVQKTVKPILGCEVYLSPTTRFDREAKEIYHLVLLVRDSDGYKNLCRLVTASYLEGFHRKPRIDKDILRQYSGGLVGLSACIKGEVPSLLLKGRIEEARHAALEYKRILGPENFYLEVQKNGIPEQDHVNRLLAQLSEELHIPLVATNDCHYLRREDAAAHDALVCIQTGKTLDDENRLKFSTEKFYLKSPEEMEEDFRDFPDAVRNTRVIADRCNFEFRFGKFHLPEYHVPEGQTLASYLEGLATEGLRARFEGADPPEEYASRLARELGIINDMGFPGYFLIVWDFIREARDKGIPVGPGRGSAAGSLVAWALRITELDPIRYNLLFERFLNPERISMPDIDVDFCQDRRGEVIEYVTRKYKEDHVAQIITFGTMAARAVIRDVGRVMSIKYAEVDRVAKLVPSVLKMTLDKALEQEPRLKELYEENEQIRELIGVGMRLEGLTRHASTHAAGVVISPQPLTEYLPLYKAPDEDTRVTQYDMKAVEQLGLLKFDFLGLKTLTVIDKAEKMISVNPGYSGRDGLLNGAFSVSRIPLDDRKTYELLSSGQTSGVFQLESSGMREILVKLQPEVFEDIIALVALYRPGPLGSGMVDDFIKRKRGTKKVEYELPELEEILKNTYGVILYQEQVMRIANKLAGFSMGEADILRKAMGKKDPELVGRQKDLFLKGSKKNRIPEKKAERIFDLIAYFAGYGFNKSHSAAYALVAYQTAYLKAHYPVEFVCALLSCDMNDTDKVVRYMNECREMGISVLPPDINLSLREFTVVEGTIRFGLEGIKGVGTSAIEAIIQTRTDNGPFVSFIDFCSRVDLRKVNRKVLESLAMAGAFDSLGYKRSELTIMAAQTLEDGARLQKSRNLGQVSFFEDEPLHETRPQVEEWEDRVLLRHEKEALGFYISGHPLEKYSDELRRFTSCQISELGQFEDRQDTTVGGIVVGSKVITTKKGDRMASFVLEDLSGSVEVIVFPNLYAEKVSLIESDAPVLIEGHMDRTDAGFKLVARKMMPLTHLQASRVELRVNASLSSFEELNRVRSVLARYEGSCPVFLRLWVPASWETVLSSRVEILPSVDMIREVEGILGKEAVHLVTAEA